MACQKLLADVRHIISWKEMPNGNEITKENFDAFMTDVAAKTVAHSEKLALSKKKD